MCAAVIAADEEGTAVEEPLVMLTMVWVKQPLLACVGSDRAGPAAENYPSPVVVADLSGEIDGWHLDVRRIVPQSGTSLRACS